MGNVESWLDMSPVSQSAWVKFKLDLAYESLYQDFHKTRLKCALRDIQHPKYIELLLEAIDKLMKLWDGPTFDHTRAHFYQ